MDEPSVIYKRDFAFLMREKGPMVYTLAFRLTGNPADGQDLAQETFVKAFENMSRFRADSSVGTWLYRICVNLWKNRVRHEKRRFFWRHFSLEARDGDELSAVEREAPDPPSGTDLETTDRQALVQKALSQLEPEERAILVMRDMDDKAYEEISALLGVPLGTVKSRIARSRERLRQLLEPLLKNSL